MESALTVQCSPITPMSLSCGSARAPARLNMQGEQSCTMTSMAWPCASYKHSFNHELKSRNDKTCWQLFLSKSPTAKFNSVICSAYMVLLAIQWAVKGHIRKPFKWTLFNFCWTTTL